MFQILIEGFALGLSTGVYCLGSCMPFLFPYLLSEGDRQFTGNIKILFKFLLGRLCAYLITGLLVGWAGEHLYGTGIREWMPLAVIISSVLLIVYGFVKASPGFALCRHLNEKFRWGRLPWLWGFLVGMNICPPFLLAISLLLERGTVIIGMTFFAAFFVGTSIFLFPVVLVSFVNRIESMKLIGRVVAVLSGIWFLILGIVNLMR